MNTRHPNTFGRRGSRRAAQGFTLIELLVVLAIMAIVTAITVGSFRSLTDNNQRTGCQANLSQLYQGLRLYMADQDGQAPPYNPIADSTKNEKKNIGLWNLWTYPDPKDVDNIAPINTAPTARYLRSTNLLHCPADTEPGVELRQNVELYVDADKQAYNPDYLSYQLYATNDPNQPYSSADKKSDISKLPADDINWTYMPARIATLSSTATAPDKERYKRQLRQNTPSAAKPYENAPLKRPPLDSTVVTFCRHHRYARDFDNVLFFDGSVQLIPREQDNYLTDGTCNIDSANPVLKGSDRVPRRADCS